MSTFSDIPFPVLSDQAVAYPFPSLFLMMFFGDRCFNFNEVQFINFSFTVSSVSCLIFAYYKVTNIFSFSFESFTVFPLIFRFLINFKLFMCDVS